MNTDYIQHLEMIQKVVKRLANNSFTYKGWSITLISALLVLSATDMQPSFALVGLLPAICFWWLDAYYLRQERLYRRLFDEVRDRGLAPGAPPTDFSMKTKAPAPTEANASEYSLFGAAFSKTIAWLHIPLLLAVIVVAVLVWMIGPPPASLAARN